MSVPPPLRIAIASEQAIFLRGLAALATSLQGVQLVGEAANAAEAAQLCELARPDLFILDLRGAGPASLEMAREVRASQPDLKIILMLDNAEEAFLDCDEPGVFCLSRDVTAEEFRTAFSLVRTGSFTPEAGRHASPDEDIDLAGESTIFSRGVAARSSETMVRELVAAGKIQADILPAEAPVIPGWDIAAALLPARETSGDFFDFIPLTPNKWGIVLADVTDKGMGAALLMALTSSLVRTFAPRYPTLPALTLGSVSERILSDTRGGMFVTAFFGILETHTGRFAYANGGHPPGYLVSLRRGKETLERLTRTGMALGVSGDELAAETGAHRAGRRAGALHRRHHRSVQRRRDSLRRRSAGRTAPGQVHQPGCAHPRRFARRGAPLCRQPPAPGRHRHAGDQAQERGGFGLLHARVHPLAGVIDRFAATQVAPGIAKPACAG
jgi:DNA-binding NarL/FixJ family response regulator